MNKKLFTSIDLTDFKKKFENSNDSNNQRYKEIVKEIVNNNEFPKDITFEEFRFIRKLLLLSKKNSSNTKKEEKKEEIKEVTETNKPDIKEKVATKSYSTSKTTKTKSSKSNSTKKDSKSSTK